MTTISNHVVKNWVARTVLPIFLLSLAVSCATMIRPPQSFLESPDDSSNQWLNAVVDIDVAEVRIIHLPLTDAFAGMKIAITRADAPVELLKVTLHANQVTRRQALWLLAERYGLAMSMQPVRGQPPYISISRE